MVERMRGEKINLTGLWNFIDSPRESDDDGGFK